ncbi:hypothetical protein GQ457_03G041110 [Hibiscus cannabinus]
MATFRDPLPWMRAAKLLYCLDDYWGMLVLDMVLRKKLTNAFESSWLVCNYFARCPRKERRNVVKFEEF